MVALRNTRRGLARGFLAASVAYLGCCSDRGGDLSTNAWRARGWRVGFGARTYRHGIRFVLESACVIPGAEGGAGVVQSRRQLASMASA